MKKLLTACLLLLAMGNTPVFSQRINDLTGINAQPNDPLSLQKRFSWVRTWHDWSLDAGYSTNCPNGCAAGECGTTCPGVGNPGAWDYRWNPSHYQTGTKLNFDSYLGGLNRRGIPILKGIAPPLRGYANYPGGCGHYLEQKPFCLNSFWCNPMPTGCSLPNKLNFPNQTNPSSYQEHALWLSLFAAKYGPTSTYPFSFVDGFTSDQGLIIGRNYIQYLEDNNEPNKNWWDTQADLANDDTYFYMTPNQFSAMLLADFNGNGGTMQAGASGNVQTLGVSNASGGVKFVMGGLAGLNGQYLKDMNPVPMSSWVANFHHYCTNLSAAQSTKSLFDAGEFVNYKGILLDGGNGYGVSPETDKLRDKLKWLVAGGLPPYSELWLSEFGYDSFGAGTSNNSGVEAPPIGNYDSQKIQAQWLTRGVLEVANSQEVDKMMLYELKDNPRNGETYSYSGLLTEGGKFKRSWFYIMTLKYLLGEYTFQEAHKNGSLGFQIETRLAGSTGSWNPANEETQLRVYEFKNGNEKVFAIWSPTQTAIAPFEARITFPNDPNNQDPDYPITGGSTLYEIKELSERGRRWNWASHVSGQVITINNEVLVSETPVFLHINKSYSTYPEPPGHATNIQCASACCSSVELTWTKPTNTSNTLIYYKKKVNGQCPAWDLVSWTLHSNIVGVNRSSTTITGLEDGAEYCFVVIPISLVGGLPPDNIENLVPYAGCGAVGNCSSCLLNISENELAIGSGSDLTIDHLKTILVMDGTPTTCSKINPNDCQYAEPGWWEWKDPANFPEGNTFYINFASPKRLKAIYAQDWYGNGDVKIQYEDCCTNNWLDLTTLQMEGTSPCNGTSYQIKHFARNVLVKRLRITKLHSDALVRRLFFCGSNEECPSNIRLPGTPSDFLADEIRENSATLRWTAAMYNLSDPSSDLADRYRLQVSQQLDANGQLVNPVTYDIEADPNQYDAMYRLSGLAPATTYHASLLAGPYPCPQTPSPPGTITTTFTTQGGGGRSAAPGSGDDDPTRTATPYAVLLRPNPAHDDVSVNITVGELEMVVLMDMSGRVLKKVAAVGMAHTLSLEGIPPGVYWVRTVRTDKTPLTVLLVKQ